MIGVVVSAALSTVCAAGNPAAEARQSVMATVGGVPIYRRQLQRLVEQTLHGREVSDRERSALEAQALTRLVERELVLSYLRRGRESVTDAEVEQAMREFQVQLDRRHQSLDDWLDSQRLSRAMFRREIVWRLNWQRACDRHLTDANLQRYFHQHRREFDGTQWRVGHILIQDDDDEAKRRSAVERLTRLRQDILAGETSFTDAARAVSEGPSAKNGGELGWIGRQGPMSRQFSQAACQLELHEISQPIITASGVHLIQCLEIRPGEQTWQDVRDELERAAAKHLFRWMADRERPRVKIAYESAKVR